MHAPGPWEWEAADEKTLCLGTVGKVFFEGTVLWCERCESCIEHDKHCGWPTKPNAILIAAAPELLAACKFALEDGQIYRLSETAKQHLCAAIAKAEPPKENHNGD